MNSTHNSTLIQCLVNSRVWRSIMRHGFPDTNFERARLILMNLFLHIHPVKVKERSIQFTYTFYLGGLSIALFFILTVSGILLMLYYHPSVPQAYNDMKDLEFVVSSGKFFRNVHRWSAHLMVIAVFLHMLRVFYTGGYKPPREFNWVIGVVLLLATLLLSYTGYLLPWDQLSFWAVTVGTNIIQAIPFLGERIRYLLLGGNIVGENALLRFYVLHCMILPGVLSLLIAIHLWRVRKDGESGDESREESLPEWEGKAPRQVGAGSAAPNGRK